MKVKFYYPPDGEFEMLDIYNVNPEDEKYFTDNDIKISLEHLSVEDSETISMVAMYADIGVVDEDGEPLETILALSCGRSCNDTLKELRELCENYKNDVDNQ